MRGWIKKALTRKLIVKGPRGKKHIEVEPSEKLVYGVSFAIYALFALVGLQVAHLAFLHSWNNEIFATISGLIGTITGILIGQRA